MSAVMERETIYSEIKFIPSSVSSMVLEALKSMLDRAKRSQGGTHG